MMDLAQLDQIAVVTGLGSGLVGGGFDSGECSLDPADS